MFWVSKDDYRDRCPASGASIENTVHLFTGGSAKAMSNKLGNNLGWYILCVSLLLSLHWFSKVVLEVS